MTIVCPHCDTINRVPNERLCEQPRCGKCKRYLFDGHPLALNDANFDKHLSHSDLPLVVDFWATRFEPCTMMASVYQQAAIWIEPRARLANVETEQNPMLVQRYGIRNIPTLVIFKAGRQVASQPGTLGLPLLTQWIEDYL